MVRGLKPMPDSIALLAVKVLGDSAWVVVSYGPRHVEGEIVKLYRRQGGWVIRPRTGATLGALT